jgi:hypothetical protein
VADEQLPDEANLSKRERQKLRRQQRLAAEQQAAKQARTRRTIATGLVVALALGALGLFGANWWMERQEQQQLIADAQSRLAELGCTEVQEQPTVPSPHLGQELPSSPPDVIYPDRPATSGPHIGQVVRSGFYDKAVDERLLVHNMEHGYVSIYYAADADAEDIADIEAFVEEQIDDGTEKVIGARWQGDLPDGASHAIVAWGARQLCEQWDRGIALAFLGDYHYLEGDAPEKSLRPHLADSGAIDPDAEEGDLLLPPLGEPSDVSTEDVMEEPEGVEEQTEVGEEPTEPAEQTDS